MGDGLTARSAGLCDERFLPERRLRRTADYRRVQRSGRRVRSRDLVMLALPNVLAYARFGLTVSRKVGNAVVRNQVKRWLREAIRRHPVAHDMSLGGVDVVFIARGSASTAGFDALSGQVSDAFANLTPRSAS